MNRRISVSRIYSHILFILFLTSSLSLFLAACEDNPVHEEDHAEPVGLIVRADGTETVRVEGNVVTGTFGITEGTLSLEFQLRFLDEDGDEFIPDDPDFSPLALIGDSTVAAVVRKTPSDWNFQLNGIREGETTIRLGIEHGSHDDYLSPEIQVIVTKDGTLRIVEGVN